MPKKSTSDLFDLIHSLSKGEKKNFKLYSKAWKKSVKSNHHKLFDVLEKMKKFDEEAVKDQLNDKKIVKNLSITKHTLYNSLLNCISSFSVNDTVIGELSNKMIAVESLLEKNLLNQCLKLILKIKREAYEAEEFSILIDILRLQERIVRKGNQQVLYPLLKTIFEEEEVIIEKIKNLNEYKKLNRNLFELMWHYGASDKKALAKNLDAIIANKLLRNITYAVSVRAKSIYYHIHGAYGFAIDELSYSAKFAHKRLELMEAYPKILMRNIAEHQGVIANLSGIYFEQHRFDDALELIHKYEALYGENLKTLSNRIQIFLFKGEISQCREMIKDADLKVNSNTSDSYRFQFIAIVAIVFFVSGEFKKAKQWNNKLLVLEDTTFNLDLFLFVRLLSVLISYELKEFHLMESMTQSLKRKLKLHGGIKNVVDIVVKYSEGLQLVKTVNEEFVLLKKLKADIEKLRGKPGGRMLDYFDISIWLKAKIENKSYEEIISAKRK